MSMIGNLLRVSPAELEIYLSNSELLTDRIYSETGEKMLSIDKAWDGINFILTGCGVSELDDAQPPLKWAIFGAQTVDEDHDLGYGPACYNTPEQVKAVSVAIGSISEADFEDMFRNSDEERRADVYPGLTKEDMPYLQGYFAEVKQFYATAAANGNVVITCLT